MLTFCNSPPHRPTQGWQYQAAALPGYARASADLAGRSLILALWSWNTPGYTLPYAVVAYSSDGNARSSDNRSNPAAAR